MAENATGLWTRAMVPVVYNNEAFAESVKLNSDIKN